MVNLTINNIQFRITVICAVLGVASVTLTACGGGGGGGDGDDPSYISSAWPSCHIGSAEYSGCWLSESCHVGVDLDGEPDPRISHKALLYFDEQFSGTDVGGIKETYGLAYNGSDCSGKPVEITSVFTSGVLRTYTQNDNVPCIDLGGTPLEGQCTNLTYDHLLNGVRQEAFVGDALFYVINNDRLCQPSGAEGGTDVTDAGGDIDLRYGKCYTRFVP